MTDTPTALTQARQQDSDARRRRVLTALAQLATAGETLNISSVARAARVHRSFIHRHNDLHAAVLAHAARAADTGNDATVSRTSLQAELANATERSRRQAAYITELEDRLSEALGEAVWRETGLGAPADLDTLHRQITSLQQEVTELRRQLTERTEELEAARAASRELMAQLNRPKPS
ncbi:hypothetical protein [Streptomyces albus]|uniref:TetR family transcriptional regulator n=1 Tax=Streptomyces albus TaxID=1888 RepID=A0A8H1L557_9ACTN|nr:hypothetical protein [Streptomyces albus]TGG78419.1 hypothetical protein D8771_24745 [Streptomyces albus]UVN59510.1 hypothetical protein NR995_33820 [Streptomyces albus]